MFFDQFRKICKINNTTPTAVIKTLGYSTSKITAWKNGAIPKADILEKLASFFDIQVSYFFDSNTMPTPPDTSIPVITIGQGGELVTFDLPPKQVPKAKKLLEVLAEDEI